MFPGRGGRGRGRFGGRGTPGRGHGTGSSPPSGNIYFDHILSHSKGQSVSRPAIRLRGHSPGGTASGEDLILPFTDAYDTSTTPPTPKQDPALIGNTQAYGATPSLSALLPKNSKLDMKGAFEERSNIKGKPLTPRSERGVKSDVRNSLGSGLPYTNQAKGMNGIGLTEFYPFGVRRSDAGGAAFSEALPSQPYNYGLFQSTAGSNLTNTQYNYNNPGALTDYLQQFLHP